MTQPDNISLLWSLFNYAGSLDYKHSVPMGLSRFRASCFVITHNSHALKGVLQPGL